MTYSISELRAKPLGELEKEYDAISKNVIFSQSYYREEIERRVQDERAAKIEAATLNMEQMTKTIRGLTWVILLLTVVTTIATVYPLLSK